MQPLTLTITEKSEDATPFYAIVYMLGVQGQGFDKEEDAKELMDNPVKHIARITQRLSELDTGAQY
jgi:hypothetical protein